MAKKYFSALRLRGERYQIAESREPAERIRTFDIVQIDRSIFKKSKAEKLLLKVAKAQAREDDLHN